MSLKKEDLRLKTLPDMMECLRLIADVRGNEYAHQAVVLLEKAIKIAGSKSALARDLCITPWALSKWNVEKILEERCKKIEEVTEGQVKAEKLRPDINWDYVRSIKNSNTAPI